MNSQPTTESDQVKKGLLFFNFAVALFHSFEAIIMWLQGSQFKVIITGTYLSLKPEQNLVIPTSHNLFEFKIVHLIAIFLIGSAIVHLFLCLPRVFDWYYDCLGRKINYVRWIEYAFTASIMTVIIAILAGMFDFSSLILLFTVSACIMISGYFIELTNQFNHKEAIFTFWISCLIGLVPWVVTFIYVLGARGNSLQSIQTYVYLIIFSLLGLFALFPINNYLALKQIGPWKNYYFVEAIYISLSWFAKSALAWQIFLGIR